MILIILTLMVSLSEGRPKSWREGPIVDPGVFVITHIKDCRNGAGYCILGTNCSVDIDFIPDDLGGHCQGLSSGFSPQASFVCCRQNPANFEESDDDKLEAVIIEHNIDHASSSVGDYTETTAKPTTESVTEKFNEHTTQVEVVSPANITETTIEDSTTITSILNNDTDLIMGNIDVMNTKEETTIDIMDVIKTPEETIKDIMNVLNTPEDTLIDKMDVMNNHEETFMDRMDVINIPEDTIIDRMDIMNTPEDKFMDRMDVMNDPEEFAELSDDSWSGQQNFYPPSLPYNGEGVGIPEVYEIEIGQTITQGESGPKVDILKPGLVIDDTESFVQSMIPSDFLDVRPNFDNSAYSNSPLSSAENIVLDYPQNENLEEQGMVDNLSNNSGVSYEMIGLEDAITNPEYDTNYVDKKYDNNVYGDQNYDHVSDLNKHGTELEDITTTEASNENEYEPDCDFSIFWGISCSYPFDS